MRIGQFADTFYPVVDGVGRVVYNYAINLPKSGNECYVIAPMVDTGYRGGFPFDLIDYKGVSILSNYPQYKIGAASIDKHYMDRIDKVEFDIVHAHTPFFAGLEAYRMAVKHNVPIVGTFHSKYYDDFYKATHAELIANIGVKYVVDFYEHCNEVWTVSELSAQVLSDYGYKGDIVVMENGTEIRPIRESDRHDAETAFGINTDAPVFLYVGQLNWKKNIMRILEACAILKRRGIRFTLVLAGQGPDESEIKERTSDFGIAECTVFTGHISGNALLDGLYQCADLFAFPSIYDTFSMVIREAAVMGTPSVVTAGSCAAQYIKNGYNGFTSNDDSYSLANVFSRAAENRSEMKSVGNIARETIPVSWDKIILKVQERYAELIRLNNAGCLPKHPRFWLVSHQSKITEK